MRFIYHRIQTPDLFIYENKNFPIKDTKPAFFCGFDCSLQKRQEASNQS